MKWWPDLESNQGHEDFQSSALPTELSGLISTASRMALLSGVFKRLCAF